jgi:hypothetical protein
MTSPPRPPPPESDPRFICRRDGHDAGPKPTGSLMQFVISYTVPCRRCGKAVEVRVKKESA